MTHTLSGSEFVIVGAGGLGGPIALALADAGAEAMRIYDHDQVELSNLQRQVQFDTDDVGRDKVAVIRDRLFERGFACDRLRCEPIRFDAHIAARVRSDRALVFIDGSDDVPTKFATADAAATAAAGFVIAGVTGYRGQIVSGRAGASACYRCLFESPDAGDGALTCENAGVFGAAVAVVAGRAARAAIDVAEGNGDRYGLTVWDDLSTDHAPRHIALRQRPSCSTCAIDSRN